jgi:hypothetical protein
MASRLAHLGLSREAFEWRELLKRLADMGISSPHNAPRIALEVLQEIRTDGAYERALGII